MRNLDSGRSALGSADTVLSEIKPEKMMLGLPALLIADRISVYENSPSFFPPGLRRYLPVGSGLKAGTEEFYVLLSCGWAGEESPELEFECLLLRPEKDQAVTVPSTTAPVSARNEAGRQTYLLRIKTESLRPGNYYLYVQAAEKTTGARATRNLAFSVSEQIKEPH